MKNLQIALLCCCFAVASQAQEIISFGPVVGPNFAKISNISNAEYNPGVAIGAQLVYSNENNWGLGGAVLYSQEGVNVLLNGEEGSTNLNYLRIPLKGYLFFGKNGESFRPKLFAGPSLGFMLNAETDYGGREVDVKSNYHTFDLGLTVGAGFNVRITEGTWFNFDAGYTHGLLDVSKFVEGGNRNIGATVGVLFGF